MKKVLQTKLRASMDYSKDMTDGQMWEVIDEALEREKELRYWKLSERRKLGYELFNGFRGWDVLQELLDRDDITEIMVNGYQNIFIEKEGVLEPYSKAFESEDKLRDVISRMVAKCNRMVNEASPIVDARLESGERINVVLPPVAIDGATLTIRKFPKKALDMRGLVQLGALSIEMAEFLGSLVRAGYNIFISGGTGSGKTTFLGALSRYIPADQRVITIEDSAELQIEGIPNLVRLETRNANLEGGGEIKVRHLIKTALRMRPTRIILGEVRGEEAADLMQCLNTGHAGSMCTGHANNACDMLARLEMMVLMGVNIPLLAIRSQIVAGVEILVHLGRLKDGSRKVLEVCEVEGLKDGQIALRQLYRFRELEQKEGKVVGVFEQRQTMVHLDKLKASAQFISS
ncbi:MAG: CpaF family protein [Lachnospiraceae bacterium]|nr:CpaF family protein [Lachnospiraceae bacterium]